MRTLLILALGLSMAAPVAAQTTQADPDDKVQGAPLPAGWSARLDKANAPPSAVKFVTMGSGFHATMGPAAIFWNPKFSANGAAGVHRARATFTQTRAPRHPEAYGILLGNALDSDKQDYVYFLVRQDGKYLIKHRAGAETHTIVDWTEHAAVKKADAEGRATNALAMEFGPTGARFFVNGQQVQDLAQLKGLSGIAGLRVNHNLDVHIADFAVEPVPGASGKGGR